MRAFRLMMKAYDSTRSAVAYVRRREGDVDELMPSRFGGRPRRRSAAEFDALAEPMVLTHPSAPIDPNVPADPDATGTQ